MTTTLPEPAELHAGEHWRVVDFISDLHLHAEGPRTFEAFRRYLSTTRASAVFILGDLFEVWVGDDSRHDAFEQQAITAMRTASERLALHVMVGNRDFLLGTAAAQAGGFTLLDDPTTLIWGRQRWLLTHGDAWCLADKAYLAVREQLRSAAWQQGFLDQDLAARRAFARAARTQSAEHQQGMSDYADVDTALALQWLRAARAPTLIHGHTHRPGDSKLDANHVRHVLTDWDLEATVPRSGILRIEWQDDSGSGAPLEGAPVVQRISVAEAP